MCGIAGFQWGSEFRPTPLQQGVLIAALMRAMDKRGGDSWGVVTKKRKVWKGIGYAYKGMPLEKLTETTQLMAHTRKKTHGTINTTNAHPLILPGIMGCHNGIISNHDELNKKRGTSWEVDSSQIFNYIAQGWPLDELRGYGAITWMKDGENGRVWMGRFNSTNLNVYGMTRDKDKTGFENCIGVIWASTSEAIKDAVELAQFPPIFPYAVEEYQEYFVEGGKLYHHARKKGLKIERSAYYQDWRGGSTTTAKTITHTNKQKQTKLDSHPRSLVRVNNSNMSCEWCAEEKVAQYEQTTGSYLCTSCTRYVQWGGTSEVLAGIRKLLCQKCEDEPSIYNLCKECRELYDGIANMDDLFPALQIIPRCRDCQQADKLEELCKACAESYIKQVVKRKMDGDEEKCSTPECRGGADWDLGKEGKLCSPCNKKRMEDEVELSALSSSKNPVMCCDCDAEAIIWRNRVGFCKQHYEESGWPEKDKREEDIMCGERCGRLATITKKGRPYCFICLSQLEGTTDLQVLLPVNDPDWSVISRKVGAEV